MRLHGFPSSLCSLPLSVPGANIVKGKVKSEAMRETCGNIWRQGETEKEGESDRWPEGGWCRREVLRVAMQTSVSFVTFTLSLWLFLLSFHLSLALNHSSILISRPLVLLIISDTFWLSPAKQLIFTLCVVHLKCYQINTCRCTRDSI